MNPPSTPRRKSVTRIIILVIGIYFTAILITALICYVQPKIYESSGAFTEWATPNQSMSVAGAHAATAVSAQSLHLRWGIPFDDAVQRVKESVVIETTASQTVIRVRSDSAQDSRILVETLMKNFPGFERERQWAQVEDIDGRYTKKEEETERQVERLKKSMFHTLQQAGHYNPGTLVTAETVTRLGNEDLHRQFKAYQKLNDPLGRFGPPDGSILIPPQVTESPVESVSPISPNIDSFFLFGKISGLLTAITVLLLIFRYQPSWLEAPPQKLSRTPAWTDLGEDATSGPASW